MKEIDKGQQIAAALAYAAVAHRKLNFPDAPEILPDYWPWSLESWKSHEDPIESLMEAQAQLSNEIIRLKKIKEAFKPQIIIPFK